jgi:AraC family transcriptional regulator of adaptative response/methylated-DNA-[protein]-cysteine methyltransferase
MNPQELRQSDHSVTHAINPAGYNAPSRVDESVPLGMTPTRFRSGARGEQIRFAAATCSLGHALAARTSRGLCWLAFGDSPDPLLADLRRQFSAAELIPDNEMLANLRSILAAIDRTESSAGPAAAPALDLPHNLPHNLPLDLRGTAFQLRVWSALQQIPSGQTRSYSQLAQQLGNPKATRAVASACAANRVALFVPCHRVVGASGQLTGYRWGTERKRRLLAAEATRA